MTAAKAPVAPPTLPAELAALGSLPGVLLPYQRALLRATAEHQVVVVEKSRRIGATWGVAADAVLAAGADRQARGMDVFYIGYNLDMAREFIDTCAMFAAAFGSAAAEVKEFLFRDQDRDIQAFRINFASGFEVVALCSRPRSLRGRQGYIILDEAAFHDDMKGVLDAALALLIWGGKVLVISTHFGIDNAFAELVNECRGANKRGFHLLRITFDEAIADGLCKRVFLKLGQPWSPEAERAWAAEIRATYGDAAGQELDCIPTASAGKYLPRALLEARASDAPVVRWQVADTFVDLSEDERVKRVRDFCEEQLRPIVAAMPADCRSFLGEDFGRSGDLSVLWPIVLRSNLVRETPFVLELRNVPFTSQAQIVFFLLDAMPRFSGAAFDARGNGQYLAEVTRQRYGAQCIAEVMLSEQWYREHMPKLRAGFEDAQLTIPRDADVIDDFRAIEVVRGVARVGERTKGAAGQRHGDAAIAAALAFFASTTIDAGPLEFAVEGRRAALGAFAGEDFSRRGFADWV